MYDHNVNRTLHTRLKELRSRSSCVRRQVAALAVHMKTGRVVAEGWNLERDGFCKSACPRAKASGVVAGVSRYDSGPTRCISIHAEDMVRRTLRAKGIRPSEVQVLVSEEPCFECTAMLQTIGLSWQVLDLST